MKMFTKQSYELDLVIKQFGDITKRLEKIEAALAPPKPKVGDTVKAAVYKHRQDNYQIVVVGRITFTDTYGGIHLLVEGPGETQLFVIDEANILKEN